MITLTEDDYIQRVLEQLFVTWNTREGPRGGLHASSILNDLDFCYREHVFGTFYKREVSENTAHLCAIFLDGWITHEKWQDLFTMELDEAQRSALEAQFEQALIARDEQELLPLLMPEIQQVKDHSLRDKWQFLFGAISGIADEVEKSHYVDEWGLSFTPDALIRIPKPRNKNNEFERYVVEIKGYSKTTFDDILKRANPMENPEFKKAAVQANLYMHMLGISKAIILIENKGDQHFRTWVRTYDPQMAEPYILKLNNVKKLIKIYRKKKLVPERLLVCSDSKSDRAIKCPLRTVCFAKPEEREVYAL